MCDVVQCMIWNNVFAVDLWLPASLRFCMSLRITRITHDIVVPEPSEFSRSRRITPAVARYWPSQDGPLPRFPRYDHRHGRWSWRPCIDPTVPDTIDFVFDAAALPHSWSVSVHRQYQRGAPAPHTRAHVV